MDEKGRKAAFYTLASTVEADTSYNFARGYIKFLLTPKNLGGQNHSDSTYPKVNSIQKFNFGI